MERATVTNDVRVLRELAKRYMDFATSDEVTRRRNLWRDHNSFMRVQPPIYVRAIPWKEVPQVWARRCEDDYFRGYEVWFQQMLYRMTIPDDYIYEPWLTVEASHLLPARGVWGVDIRQTPKTQEGGSWQFDPPLKTLDDIEALVVPRHRIDEEATARKVDRLREAIGDIIPVVVDRAPVWRMWNADISTMLARLRGLEQVMWDMVDNPEWLHRLLAFMRDGVLAAQAEAEVAGDWRLCDHQNQAMPYARELADPSVNPTPVSRNSLWVFCAAQEFTLVSPAMHEEFMLQYQLPIISRFGLASYGCCEDLTDKIDLLRQIPNLRRIAVAPRAHVRRCAEQIGAEYILSYRPNPADMVCCEFDPAFIRATVRKALDDAAGCFVDITLKDVETVQGQPERLREWVRIVREVTEA